MKRIPGFGLSTRAGHLIATGTPAGRHIGCLGPGRRRTGCPRRRPPPRHDHGTTTAAKVARPGPLPAILDHEFGPVSTVGGSTASGRVLSEGVRAGGAAGWRRSLLRRSLTTDLAVGDP